MLSTEDMREHVARMTWKPGYRLELYEGRFEGPHLFILGPEVDSTNPAKTVDLGVHSMVPPMETVEQLKAFVQWRLCRLATHEAREWLRYDGQVAYDPHAAGAHEDRP